MNLDGPPRIATWVLVRLVSGPRRESLIGDLLERYQQKRSTVWFWQQVLAAIVATNAVEIWNHRILALRAIVLGWSVTYVLDLAVGSLLSAALPSSLLVTFSTGGRPSVFAFMLNAVVLVGVAHTAIVRVCTGWILARSHRPHEVPMVFAFLASFLILDLPWLFRRGVDAATGGGAPLVAAFAIHLVALAVTITAVTVGMMSARVRRVQAA